MNHSLLQKLILVALFTGVVIAFTGNHPARDADADASPSHPYTTSGLR